MSRFFVNSLFGFGFPVTSCLSDLSTDSLFRFLPPFPFSFSSPIFLRGREFFVLFRVPKVFPVSFSPFFPPSVYFCYFVFLSVPFFLQTSSFFMYRLSYFFLSLLRRPTSLFLLLVSLCPSRFTVSIFPLISPDFLPYPFFSHLRWLRPSESFHKCHLNSYLCLSPRVFFFIFSFMFIIH